MARLRAADAEVAGGSGAEVLAGFGAAQGNYTLNISCAAPAVPMCTAPVFANGDDGLPTPYDVVSVR